MNLRDHAYQIMRQAFEAADPRKAIAKNLRWAENQLLIGQQPILIPAVGKIFVIGYGKASASMAEEIEHILGERITAGWINTKYGHTAQLEKIRTQEAGHPLVDQNGLSGTREILQMIDRVEEGDVVICLTSGGGSALLELPVEEISLEDLQQVSQALLRCGANIGELNTIRKHLSQVKGGRLAQRLRRGKLINLVLSDVIGSPLDTIASGPTSPDSTTFADVQRVIEKYTLEETLPEVVREYLWKGKLGLVNDTPKEGDPGFARIVNLIIADNRVMCEQAVHTAKALGYQTQLMTTRLQGEAREVAHVITAIAREVVESGNPVEAPACLIFGGETTVTIRGEGLGGRNQEMALAAAIDLQGQTRIAMICAGSDGTDGPTDAAGAYVDGKTLMRGTEKGIEALSYLQNNDSYHYFKRIGDLVITGPTGTNVNDLVVVLVGK
ncbi:MAG TPA: glycerate kinase [Anaerolineaceae bacterium]